MGSGVNEAVKKCFPEFLALINPIALSAYNMRFVQMESLVSEVILTRDRILEPAVKGSGPREWSPRLRTIYDVFDKTTMSDVKDAILLIQPYLYITRGTKKPVGQIHMTVDGEVVVNQESLGKFWVKDRPERSDPYDLYIPLKTDKRSSIFTASAVDANNLTEHHGLMLPNGTRILMRMIILELEEEIAVEVGCVAATYTAKPKTTEEL